MSIGHRSWLVGPATAGVAGCGPVPVPTSRLRPSLLDIHGDDGTDRAITPVVDGAPVGTVPANASLVVPESQLPPGNWNEEARACRVAEP